MVVFKCRVHGELDEETGFKQADKNQESGYRLRCKQCTDERRQKNIDRNIANGFKMPDEIKGHCKKHGELNKISGYICFDKTLNIGYRIRCKECTHRIASNAYLNNRQHKINVAVKWKKENRNRVNEQVKLDRKTNPEKYKRWASDHYNRNRNDLSLKMSLKERKIDKDFYENMITKQNNKCAICDMEETRMARDGKSKTRLCIDHDHGTQQVRQLLCHDCNTGIGKFKDCPELVLNAADYLIKHKGWTV